MFWNKKTIWNPTMVLMVVVGLVVSGGGSANADFTFGTLTNLGPTVNSSAWEWAPSISADGLELFFTSNRPGGYGGRDIWVTTRDTIDDEWGTPMNLGPTVNTSGLDSSPNILADGLSLYFASSRTGALGDADLYVATREKIHDGWGTPVKLGAPVNSSYLDGAPSISANGLSMYLASDRPGGYGSVDLWVTTRPTKDDPWATPVNLGPTVNGSAFDTWPSISADGLVLFFGSNRPGGSGGWYIRVTTRETIQGPWGEPVNLGPTINSSADEYSPGISPDGSTLYFGSSRLGSIGAGDIWQVEILPVVDFNADGIVDCVDICLMVDYWGTDEPLYDIGPTPLGDGIVDVQDLIVLAEHLFTDYRLVAHWKLDEVEGNVAHDSAGDHDGILNGNPLWQPVGGQIDGALQFDGIDDYLSTDFILNPMDGAFSFFAWIRGGVPGQAILSQADTHTERGVQPGSTWLGTDPSEGKFMASLTHAVLPLKSDFVITDDQWHDIGLVYDGSSKYLYVDGAEVAEDNLRPLLGSDGGLYIGAGKTLDATSFWSGLIDDVRIYDEALTTDEIQEMVR